MSDIPRIKYDPLFKKKMAVRGYPIEGLFYQFVGYKGRDEYGLFQDLPLEDITETTEAISHSYIRTAYSANTKNGLCVTIRDLEYPFETKYNYLNILYRDLAAPDKSSQYPYGDSIYNLAATMDIPEALKTEVDYMLKKMSAPTSEGWEWVANNMVFLNIPYMCDLNLLSSDTEHIMGSFMDKEKYTYADKTLQFLEMSPARRVLLDDMVSRTKKKDVFQISTSGLIKI